MDQLKSDPFNWVKPKVKIKKLIDHVEKLIKSNQILNQINQDFSNTMLQMVKSISLIRPNGP